MQRFQMTETLPHFYWDPENSSALSMACYKAITSSHLRKKNSLFDINFFKVKKTSENVELIDEDIASKLSKTWTRFTGE